jgi:hypothetical protein|nr:MAG TPA: hypothetical protein [Caudoviricetes sp.]
MTILEDTKTYLGLMEDDPSFDSEVKDAIDNALATATQLNREVGDLSSEADYPATTLGRILRQYVNYSVRLAFDPPQTSFAIKAIEALKQESEWRLTIQ